MDRYTPPSAREESRADWAQYVHEAHVAECRHALTETPEEALRVVLAAIGLDYDATMAMNCSDMPVFRAVAAIYSAVYRTDAAAITASALDLAQALHPTLAKLAEERAA